jgi:hypothetical protein
LKVKVNIKKKKGNAVSAALSDHGFGDRVPERTNGAKH